jgi:hypothetical protein
MKRSIIAAIGIATLVAGSAIAVAGDEQVIYGNQHPLQTRDQKAVSACLNAFVAEAMPNSSGTVRKVSTGGAQEILSADSSRRMDVTIKATAKSDKTLLAWGICTVNNAATVEYLPIHFMQKDRLARMSLADLSLALALR